MNHDQILLYSVIMLIGIGVYVMLQSYVIGLNMTSWTFRGAAFVKLIVPVTPIFFLIAVILIPVYYIMEAED